jgi:glycosyltransferase involved in cell wall biosynthesis
MNIWIVNPYGNLPNEGWREYRSAMLARALASSGHKVIWWISNFEHRTKRNREAGYLEDTSLPETVKIISVKSTFYNKNISIERIKYEKVFGNNFSIIAKTMQQPDFIVLADPSLFYSRPVKLYAKNSGVKIILDVLDLWPEQFKVALPKFLRFFESILFYPLYRRRNKLVDTVDGVIAVTKDHLQAVLSKNNKPSLVAYLGLDYDKFQFDSRKDTSPNVQNFVADAELVAIYAGTLGEAYDMLTLIQAIKLILSDDNNKNIKFIFVGDGPYRKEIILLSETNPNNVLFLGTIPAENLPSIYNICHVGLCSYNKFSTVTMPVKLYDYLAGDLFVLYSSSGEIDEILSSNSLGIKYQAENFQDLASKINKVKNEKTLIKKCGRSSNYARNFDQKLQHNKIVTFIENL